MIGAASIGATMIGAASIGAASIAALHYIPQFSLSRLLY